MAGYHYLMPMASPYELHSSIILRMSFRTFPFIVNSFIRLLHYLVQQSISITLYAADVLHDGIVGAELHWFVEIFGE